MHRHQRIRRNLAVDHMLACPASADHKSVSYPLFDVWAAASRGGLATHTRGVLRVATADSTTLMGAGLQHDDARAHMLLPIIPCYVSYDAAFSCELAVIVQNRLRRMHK
jgi:pyruvate dehydrogenase complex dehydrogenase (E1) component